MRTRSPSCRTIREHAERQRAVSRLHGVHQSSLMGVGPQVLLAPAIASDRPRGPAAWEPVPGGCGCSNGGGFQLEPGQAAGDRIVQTSDRHSKLQRYSKLGQLSYLYPIFEILSKSNKKHNSYFGLRGDPSTIFWSFCKHLKFVPTLFTVYLLHELKVPGPLRDPGHKSQFSNPWRSECSEGSCSGHKKRSGRCQTLNATALMCDNLAVSRICTWWCLLKERSSSKSAQNSSCIEM